MSFILTGVDSPAPSAGAASVLPPVSAAPVGRGTIMNVPPVGESDRFNDNFVANYDLDAEGGDESLENSFQLLKYYIGPTFKCKLLVARATKLWYARLLV